MTALIVIDVQKAIDHPKWANLGSRNNPDAERNIARLLTCWRDRKWPIFHVRHDSREPDSPYRPGQEGNEFKPEVAPLPGETIIPKQAHSAFVETGLEQLLRSAGHLRLVVTGVITNNSVEATVRMGADLGFDVYLVEDACFTFARSDCRGRLRTADEVHDLSIANMSGEYCTVLTTDQAVVDEYDITKAQA
jgi:nicotinamidase-related amidase